ncbi:MAG: lipase maturation factor family protein [Candidatus Omnitrophica bacterium]|nr:lipase maturation factor family protein [Candidatus Omnitrophota bacterium]
MNKKPLLIYDGDCGFCRRWIERWRLLTGEIVDYAPYQEVGEKYSEISTESFQKSVQLIETDGNIFSGAEAVFRTLWLAGKSPWLLWLYKKFPIFKGVSEWGYRLVAENRSFFSHLTRLSWGDDLSPSAYFYSRSLFLRALGLVYFFAFFSLALQSRGLLGANGILPFEQFLSLVTQRYGLERYLMLPTLAWLYQGDAMLVFLTVGGVLLSLVLIAGFWPAPTLFLLWFFYLSLVNIARDFLSFQWDILLLEAGFIAFFLAPRVRHLREAGKNFAPPAIFVWLIQWLLFRLNFSSGFAKLASGDPNWRNLTALTYHYETQPLPTWIGWFAHQLPANFHYFSAVVMFGMELLIPFLIFSPRRLRSFAAVCLIGFQMLIMLTGNYCFFNLLAISLCLFLIDDQTWHKFFPRLPLLSSPEVQRSWPVWLVKPVGIFLILTSVAAMSNQLQIPLPGSKAIGAVYRVFAPFHLVNHYGLFAVMTTKRPEIIIEGSNDKENWEPYEFRYKAGDLKTKPGFILPHQPRLDWQMWFAALNSYKANPWFIHFCVRLLKGSPDVLSLLKTNPFPNAPPHYLRARVYEYHFTDLKTQRQFGFWWERELMGLYCPVMSLRDTSR